MMITKPHFSHREVGFCFWPIPISNRNNGRSWDLEWISHVHLTDWNWWYHSNLVCIKNDFTANFHKISMSISSEISQYGISIWCKFEYLQDNTVFYTLDFYRLSQISKALRLKEKPHYIVSILFIHWETLFESRVVYLIWITGNFQGMYTP